MFILYEFIYLSAEEIPSLFSGNVGMYSCCRDAALMSMRRKIAGLRSEQIRQLPKEELDLPITAQDFKEALAKCKKSVSKEDLDKYEKWMLEYGFA
jgi:SpoVK/Ycf46/Vps4 family AAA+-type ATPase